MAFSSVGRGLEYWTLTVTSDHDVNPVVDAALVAAQVAAQAAYDAAVQAGGDASTEKTALDAANVALAAEKARAAVAADNVETVRQVVGMRGEPIIMGDWNAKAVKFAIDCIGTWSAEDDADNSLKAAFARDGFAFEDADATEKTAIEVTVVSTTAL